MISLCLIESSHMQGHRFSILLCPHEYVLCALYPNFPTPNGTTPTLQALSISSQPPRHTPNR
jgi:hypothetical protein